MTKLLHSCFRRFNRPSGFQSHIVLLIVLVAVLAGCSKQKAIYHAAAYGDLAKVKVLLKESPELISSKDPKSGGTPLFAAALAKQPAVVEFLLASGADINGRDRHGVPLLCYLSLVGYKDMVQLFLAHGADVNIRDEEGDTPLQQAAIGGHPEVVQMLLASHADINTRDYQGFTPMHEAAMGGFPKVAEVLLANQADINARDTNGFTPLSYAVSENQPEVAAYLRQHGGQK